MAMVIAWVSLVLWCWIVIKSTTELTFTIRDYGKGIFIEDSPMRTNQISSVLIAMLASSLSAVLTFFHYEELITTVYAGGIWMPLAFLKVMFLYLIEIIRQRRAGVCAHIGFIDIFKIRAILKDGKLIEVN